MTAPDPTTSGDVDIDPRAALQQQNEQATQDEQAAQGDQAAGPEPTLTTNDEAQRDSVVKPANS